jgi:flagellar biosynthesis protein FlhB
MSEGGDKTEEPTPKKLDDARKKGQVWKSKDLTGAFTLILGLGTVKVLWSTVEEQIQELFRFAFVHMANPKALDSALMRHFMDMALYTALLLMVPVLAVVIIVAVLVEFLQVGPLFTLDPLLPKLDKLNPIQGIKNIFSKKTVVELVKNIVKLSVTGYVVYGVVRDAMGLIAVSVLRDTATLTAVMGEVLTRICMRACLLLLVFSIFDVWWQHYSYMKDQMMSKDDVKKEYKESEGDPHHKAKRKELHMEIMEGAEMNAVQGADVVVTNPDHVAVALKYDKEKDAAPRVLSKGLDFKAERIKGVARDFDVPVLRNVPLAHALYRVEAGEEIPEELYDAVAEVLNFVYGLKSQAATPAQPERGAVS